MIQPGGKGGGAALCDSWTQKAMTFSHCWASGHLFRLAGALLLAEDDLVLLLRLQERVFEEVGV